MRPFLQSFLQSSSWFPQRSKPGLIIRCKRRHDNEGVELFFTKSFLSITPGEVAYYCFEHNQQKPFRDFQPEIQLNYEEIIDFQTIEFRASYHGIDFYKGLRPPVPLKPMRRTYISTHQETYEFYDISDAASQKRLRQLEVPNLRFGGDRFTLDVINTTDGGNGEAFDRSAMTREELPQQIWEFYELLQIGAITPAEYEKQKSRILKSLE